MSTLFSKANQKQQAKSSTVTISINNFNNDKLQYGVPIRRQEKK